MKSKWKLFFIFLGWGFIASRAQAQTLPHNLIQNSYMNILEGSTPIGYQTLGGTLMIEAVHPFTKGFEGPYVETEPANSASSVDAATETNPYWFGRYNKGPRANRGGLADGWHGYRGGHVLKITGDNSGTHAAVFFPFERNVLTNRVHFQAWIKIASGESVSFGADAGYTFKENGFTLTKAMADQAIDGWYRINEIISISEVTSLDHLSFSMGLKGDSIEVYLALPYLAVVDNDSWIPSISDYLTRNGFNAVSGKVGIGTSAIPDGYSLAVDGKSIMEEVVVQMSDQWPDYVFDTGYRLPDLRELEIFISKYKHLPGLPAKEEIEQDGQNLGAVQVKLLEKVEELTLYTIRQQKLIESQYRLILKLMDHHNMEYEINTKKKRRPQ